MNAVSAVNATKQVYGNDAVTSSAATHCCSAHVLAAAVALSVRIYIAGGTAAATGGGGGGGGAVGVGGLGVVLL